MTHNKWFPTLLVALFCNPLLNLAGEVSWPSFRGSDSRGVSQSPDLPMTWSEKENVTWKQTTAGRGWSSPIVWDETVFMVSVKSRGEVEAPIKGLYFGGERPEPSKDVHAWVVEAIDTQSGSIRWASTLHEAAPSSTIHVKNTYASETPVTDGKHVYVHFGYMGLYCLDWNGAIVWKHQWPPAAMRLGWGTSSSPILHDQWVIIVNDNEEQSWIAAYDKKSGQEQWKVLRDEPSNFSTPFVWENDMRTEIITTGVNKTRSYDLMGQPLWTIQRM